MITMQEMEKELEIYRKSFTKVRLISEADILHTLEARKRNPASRACPCRDGRMTTQGCRNCVVIQAYLSKCKKIKLEYDEPNIYQVTARYLHVDGQRYVLELVQKLDDDMMIDAESGEKLANRLSSFQDKLYHDALTGALNRRYYEEHMCKTVYEAGIAMIDVDNFKLYNDIFGHRAGDIVLETMAQSVKQHTASGDMLVRLGGDEFLLVMPGIPADRLYSRLLQVCEAVHSTPVPGYTNLQISISIGGVMCNGRPLDVAVEQADYLLMNHAKAHMNAVVTETMLAQEPDKANALRKQRECVLIVDDSELNRELLAEMLNAEYDILEASNGQECMDILNTGKQKISLILLDLLMPVMDGFEVLAAMNRNHMLENLPVIMISSEDSDAFIRRAYEQGVSDYISRPFDARVVYRRVFNTIKLYAKQRRLVSMVTSEIMEKEKNSMIMVNILAHAVEFRSGECGLHELHMRMLVERLLETLCAKTDRYSLTPQDCGLIEMAALMHDIGKIAVDEKILNKPGKLTPEEFEQVKQHTLLGAKMLDATPYRNEKLVQMAYDICRWHHERYDGGGYPDGLVGDEIPIAAQVVSIADVYDALISKRVYKPAYPHEQAVKMILSGECGTFNPILLDCLKELQETLRCEFEVPPFEPTEEHPKA